MTVTTPIEVRTSYSALLQHRQCPQKWRYSRVLKLERLPEEGPRVELEFGSWWHALMAVDSLTRGRDRGSLRVVPDTVTTVDGGPKFDPASATAGDVIEGAAAWYWNLPDEWRADWEKRLGGTLSDRLAYTYARWLEEWEKDREAESPLAVEMGWERVLPGTDVALIGFIDEVYLDERRGIVVVRDHKTSKALGTQSSLDDMMESQLQLYAWGAHPVVSEWGLGPVAATAYDRVRSVAPKTPQITQAGSLSKSVTDFDLHTYLKFAAGPNGMGQPYPGRYKDGRGAGMYQAEKDVVSRLSSSGARSAWRQRTLIPLNANIVRAHVKAAIHTAQAASETRLMDEAPRNLSSGCKWCDFADLCRAQMMGGQDGDYPLADYGLRQRQRG